MVVDVDGDGVERSDEDDNDDDEGEDNEEDTELGVDDPDPDPGTTGNAGLDPRTTRRVGNPSPVEDCESGVASLSSLLLFVGFGLARGESGARPEALTGDDAPFSVDADVGGALLLLLLLLLPAFVDLRYS